MLIGWTYTASCWHPIYCACAIEKVRKDPKNFAPLIVEDTIDGTLDGELAAIFVCRLCGKVLSRIAEEP